MTKITCLHCRCGAVEMEAAGDPIMSNECMCNSCRSAADIMEALPDAPAVRSQTGGTPMVMYRKDRVRCVKGAEHLREFRLTEKAKTRRAVATCCNTPVLLDFTNGHWIDLYAPLWPQGTLPPLELRTMAGDLDDPSVLPDDVPNLKSHSFGFFWRLIGAWVAMRFATPKIDYINGVLDTDG